VTDLSLESNGPAQPASVKPNRKAARSRVKNYVIDTNVLLHDPQALLNFQDNHVLIPIEVIEEIDRFKRDTSERGQNARRVSRMLDEWRAVGRLSDGVPLPNGGLIRIIFAEKQQLEVPVINNGSTDNRILALALSVQRADPKTSTILVTKDINLRLKADVYGLSAEDYETDRVNLQDLYTGSFEVSVSAEQFSRFKLDGFLALPEGKRHFPNEFCTVSEASTTKRTVLTKVDPTGTKLVPLMDVREGIWGIKPRNREQHFALDALLDERVRLVTLMGKGRHRQNLDRSGGRIETHRDGSRVSAVGGGASHDFHGQGTRLPAGISRGEVGSLDATDPRCLGDVGRSEHGS
jgi:PhoH-like ATPase